MKENMDKKECKGVCMFVCGAVEEKRGEGREETGKSCVEEEAKTIDNGAATP